MAGPSTKQNFINCEESLLLSQGGDAPRLVYNRATIGSRDKP